MTQLFFEECDCDCHRKIGDGNIPAKTHIVACCSTCRLCGKRIKRGFEATHFDRMHKREAEEMRKTEQGFLNTEYIKDSKYEEE